MEWPLQQEKAVSINSRCRASRRTEELYVEEAQEGVVDVDSEPVC